MSRDFTTDPNATHIAEESGRFLRSVLFAVQCISAFVVVFATIVTLTVFGRELTLLQAMLMTAMATAYLVWSTIKSPALIYSSLETGKSLERVPKTNRIWIYFVVQLALAESAICVTAGTQAVLLLWLLLLPTVSQATMILGRLGVLSVSGLCVVMDAVATSRALGKQAFPTSLAQFGLSLAFVIIVTEFVVRAVKSRQESIRLEGELHLANLRLRKYAIQAEEFAAARERYRLAREIHDTIGHALTVVNVQLEVALTVLDRDPATARDAIDKSQTVVREGLQEIRASVSELRTSPIENRSLVDALRRVVAEVDTMECPVEFEVQGTIRDLAQREHLCLFRAGQECVTNAKRHSSATRISVTLDFRDRDAVSVSVKDNGCGVIPLRDGFGLIGIRERSQEVGGQVLIESAAKRGLEVTVRVPG